MEVMCDTFQLNMGVHEDVKAQMVQPDTHFHMRTLFQPEYKVVVTKLLWFSLINIPWIVQLDTIYIKL